MSKTLEVTLLKDHKHAGKPYKAGAKITVALHDAEWLANANVIDPLPGDTKTLPGNKENAK